MRAIFLATLAAAAIGAAPAYGDEPTAPAAAAASESADAKADAPATAAEDKIYLPAGFKVKKRGKFTLYCRKEDVMGTRFPVEKCYDEQGIRDYVLDQRENQKQVDQMRRICGSMEACGGGG